MSLRDDVVANALWGVAHEPDIHYRQSRPIDGLNQPHKLPLYTDCSGFVTCCYAWAGVVDPNGNQYDGAGYTGTLLFLDHVTRDELQPADLIVFGPGNGDHVVIVVDNKGSDLLCVSHGQEAGPIKVRLSQETKAHRPPVTFLRGTGLDDEITPQSQSTPVPITLPEDTVRFHYAQPDNSPKVYLVSLAAPPRHVTLFADAEYWAKAEGHEIIQDGDHDLGADPNKQTRKGIILDAKGRELFGLA